MSNLQLGQVQRDPASAYFFDAAGKGVLVLPKCTACGEWQPLTTQVCTDCGKTVFDWAPASGTGSVVTWTALPDPEEAAGHRVLVMVELSEGPWFETRLIDGALDQVVSGLPVSIGFLTPANSEPIPVAYRADLSSTEEGN